jgi:hypothetical protein
MYHSHHYYCHTRALDERIECKRDTMHRRCGIFSVRFMLDGENINPESTPADMDLEDDDQIDVFLAQVGGRISA